MQGNNKICTLLKIRIITIIKEDTYKHKINTLNELHRVYN